MALDSIVTINRTLCGCDGTISIFAYGGNPPYTYSIDTGISYKNSPLFFDLCYGLYNVVVKDISGNTKSNTVFLEKPSGNTIYSVSLNTLVNQSVNSPFIKTFNYTSTLTIEPELPSGVTLTFDIRHTNTTSSSPSLTACTATTNSQLEVNNIFSGISSSAITTATTYNFTPGCQNETQYINSLTEVWNDVTYVLGDNLELSTTTTILKNIDIDCYLGTSKDVFTISNLRINGCSCCKAIVT